MAVLFFITCFPLLYLCWQSVEKLFTKKERLKETKRTNKTWRSLRMASKMPGQTNINGLFWLRQSLKQFAFRQVYIVSQWLTPKTCSLYSTLLHLKAFYCSPTFYGYNLTLLFCLFQWKMTRFLCNCNAPSTWSKPRIFMDWTDEAKWETKIGKLSLPKS